MKFYATNPLAGESLEEHKRKRRYQRPTLALALCADYLTRFKSGEGYWWRKTKDGRWELE